MVSVWKDVEGYEGFYQVSNMVKVRSLDRMGTHWKGGLRLIKGRILKPGLNKQGYLAVALCNGSGQVTKAVHRLVAEAFIPNPNNYPEINHKNRIRTDNRVENLEWCTGKQNVRHAIANGSRTNLRGEKSSNVKLTERQVIEIKARLLQGCRGVDLAKEYGVHKNTIGAIKAGRNWSHV